MSFRTLTSAFIVAAVFLGVDGEASAQARERSLGFGPRFSFVRGNIRQDVGSSRYSGALLRASLSKRTAVEVSLDYRSHLNESLAERIRDYPIQGSLLMYPVRSALSPYLLFGIGWYSQRIDRVGAGSIIEPTTTRTMGYHAGMGGEIRVGGRTAIHLDYRYTFIRFGGADNGAPGAIPLPGLTGLQERLKLSHQGSMWTTGFTVYF